MTEPILATAGTVIVDTSVWIDFLAGTETAESLWLKEQLGTRPFAVTDLILCEILQGLRSETEARRVQRQLGSLPVASSGGEALAIAAARNYRTLRAKGITVRKTIDCLIATVCIQSDYALLHRDSDFHPFETHLGLRVIHPPPH